MSVIEVALPELLSAIVDNRGRSCPTADVGFPLIATNCVRRDRVYPTFENVRYVDSDTYENWFRAHPEPGDILFVCKGDPGRTALVPDPVPFAIAQDMVALRADLRRVDPLYLFYAIRSPIVQDRIVNMHVGTMIPHFKKGDFGKLTVPTHDTLEEQQAIAEVLGALDDKIAANTALIAKANELADASYRASLDFSTSTNLGAAAEFHNRRRVPLSASQRERRAGSVPYFGANGQMGSVDVAIFDEPLVLVGEDGSVAREDGTPFVHYSWGPIWVNNHAHVLTGTAVSTELLAVILRQTDISALVTGAVQPKLSMGQAHRIEFALPNGIRLERLESLISLLFASVRSAREENRTLVTTRDALLPQLMSGKLRVRDVSEAGA